MKTERKNREFEESLPLILTSVTGQPLRSFPGEVIENLRSLVTRIGKKGEFPARLSLVAALRGEGVTYTTQALAAILANDLSAKVCLIDLNWWWTSSTPLVASDSPGVAAVLKGCSKPGRYHRSHGLVKPGVCTGWKAGQARSPNHGAFPGVEAVNR